MEPSSGGERGERGEPPLVSLSLRIEAAAIAAAAEEGDLHTSLKRIGERACCVARTTLRRDSAGNFSNRLGLPLLDSPH